MEKGREKNKFFIYMVVIISLFAVIAVAVTALSSVYFAKLMRFVNSVQHSLPTFKKAAQFYVDKNTMAEYCSSGDE